MFRKMLSVAAILAFLSASTAGPCQARQVADWPAPTGFLQEIWHWAVSGPVSIFMKDTSNLDPNGLKSAAHPNGPSVFRRSLAGMVGASNRAR
jgi:hypothetical protein